MGINIMPALWDLRAGIYLDYGYYQLARGGIASDSVNPVNS